MKTLKHTVILFYIIITGVGAAMAQTVEVKAVIDSLHVLIGDQFNLRLEVDQPLETTVVFPETGDSVTTSIEVIARSPLDTFRLNEEQRLKIIQNLTITSFDTGRQVLPALRFAVMRDDLADTIKSLPVEFFVHSMPIDTTKGPVDIKRPYGAPLTLKEVSPYIMGAIVGGALLFFIFYYINQRRNNRPVFGITGKPKEPAHIIALRELDRIKEQKLWEKNQVKAYYSDIADTLRVYMEDRFAIPAMEYTTAETIDAFTRNRELLPAKALLELKNLLGLSDLVKFAKYIPTTDDHNITLMNAYFFVNDTKPEEAQAQQKTENDNEGEEVNY